MKACWDNMERLKYNPDDGLFRITVRNEERKHTSTTTYKLTDCAQCGEECFVRFRKYKDKPGKWGSFCDAKCHDDSRRKSKEYHTKRRREWEREWRKINREAHNLKKKLYHRKRRKEDPERMEEIWRKSYLKRRHTIILSSIKQRVKRKKLDFDLDKEWIKDKIDNSICEMTRLPFDLENFNSPYGPSVDRIDPKKGYTKDNCRMVLTIMNLWKRGWDDTQLYEAAQAFVENYKAQ